VSKSSANPRRYSRGKDLLDPLEPLVVYVETRMSNKDLESIEARLEYLLSRRPAAVAKVVGVRQELNRVIATIGIDMGPMRAALRGTSQRMLQGYDILRDIWEQMVEYSPVFASPPATSDKETAQALGFAQLEFEYLDLEYEKTTKGKK